MIDEDQCGFLQCRQTQGNIRRTLHTIDYIKKEKLRSVLPSIDAEKTFDSVRWGFLHKVMGKFGFHKKFMKSIKTLFRISRVEVNRRLSRTIHLQHGCRQGCSASPGLYNLFIELLAQAIRQDSGLGSIMIRGTQS